MPKKFFGLVENPYFLVPDPRYLWYSDQHLEAKSKLVHYLTEPGQGFIYLISERGTGKTILAKRILQELIAENPENEDVIAYISVPPPSRGRLTINSFLRMLMDEFGVKTERSYVSSLRNFESHLSEQYSQGKHHVLLLDEAQNMTGDTLKLIQHFFNFSTDSDFLLRVAMFTQPELQKAIDKLPSLKSRLNVAKLKSLSLDQVKELLQARWTTAGGKELPFTDEAIEQFFHITGGNPREIINLANEALLQATLADSHTVTRELVNAANLESKAEDFESEKIST